MRTRTALAAAAVAMAAVALAPSPALADAGTCTVSAARVSWPSGGGDLTPSGAIELEDGVLLLDGGAGVLDPVGPTGSIAFEGDVSYTSAAGVATTLSNPTVVVDGGEGMLLFDVQPDGTELIPQAALATIDLRAAAISEGDGTAMLDGVEATTDLTSEGVDVLWSGAPGALDLAVEADCPGRDAAATPTAGAEPAEEDGGSAGLWIAVGVTTAASVLTVLLAAGSVQRRKRNSARSELHEQPSGDGPR